MRGQINKRSNSSSLWRQMGNIIAQYDGMLVMAVCCCTGLVQEWPG